MFSGEKIFFVGILLLMISSTEMFSQKNIDYSKLEGIHDLSLPDWGPYTKRYIGVSHIPEKNAGIRFDLSVFPGFYRRKVFVPNVLFENSYHPWEASPDLEYFSFRHELEWKDQVYADISYSEINDKSRLIRMECVNNTENNQNLAMHFMASINFPPIKEYSPYTSIYPAIVTLPEGAKWFDAIEYEDLQFAKQRPSDNLVVDGKMRGEIRDDGFVNGSGIGNGFGMDKGDFVAYNFNLESPVENAVIYIRYKMSSKNNLVFTLSGITETEIILKGKEGLNVREGEDENNVSGAHGLQSEPDLTDKLNDFCVAIVKLGRLESGENKLTLTSNGGNAVEIDGFVILDENQVDNIHLDIKKWNPVPQFSVGPVDNSLIIKYDDVDIYYGLLWQFPLYEIREWNGRDLADYFKQMVNEHVKTVFEGEGNGHYLNVFMKPIELQPSSSRTIYGIICSGSEEEVENCLSEMNAFQDKYEHIYADAKQKVIHKPVNPEGEKYTFSVERMQATLSTNVVYPVYTQKQYIRHSAPGRWWDCLYTWDSGFIGLGHLQTDTRRAVENLNAYVQEPDAQSAFIHHGSPVPVQQYLFSELWNTTQSKEMLEYFYPRLKQYHDFMAGHFGSSTMNSLKSDLLKTWDYFYNSGGWDDYPPQKYTHDNQLEATVTPVINTSHAIRSAKMLRMAARYLGKDDEVTELDNDIKTFTDAIQDYAWDEKSGYFGYVVHDKDGNPTEILKYKDEVNYNMGYDGAYPLIAGICTEAQKEQLLSYLKSDKHIWSSVGLSAVDQSAPYYRIDGYWNGTVWMPHQWFFWKTMLDMGEDEFAFKIATTALDVWKKEVEATYNCMEHFLIETGRGAGWHEFSGLSSPVVVWYSAYFCPGNFTAGFDTWVENKSFNENNTSFSADLTFTGTNNKSSVVVCMNPDYEYEATWNGEIINFKTLAEGTLSIPIADKTKGKLIVKLK